MFEANGYKAGVDLWSAPFDWRLGPNQWMVNEFPALQTLVETAFTTAGDKPVWLSSISLGGAFTHLFLVKFVDQAWKDKYLAGWVSMSSVLNGAANLATSSPQASTSTCPGSPKREPEI